jgi:hypothetical protein
MIVKTDPLGDGLTLALGETDALAELDGLTEADGETEGLTLELPPSTTYTRTA